MLGFDNKKPIVGINEVPDGNYYYTTTYKDPLEDWNKNVNTMLQYITVEDSLDKIFEIADRIEEARKERREKWYKGGKE